ncbi:MAG: YggU family protein [Deltaproteobacteria bacterium]|nr:YggU family protein [Deltaproteobacteria bacterium]
MPTPRETHEDESSAPTVISEAPGGVSIRVRVQPRSSRNQTEGVHNGAIRIRLTSPPVEGAANEALIGFFSKLLGVRKGAIHIEAGTKSRDKRVFVEGLSKTEAAEALGVGP